MLLAFVAADVLVITLFASAVIVGLFIIVARMTPLDLDEDDGQDVPEQRGPAHRDWITDDGRLDDTVEIDVTEEGGEKV